MERLAYEQKADSAVIIRQILETKQQSAAGGGSSQEVSKGSYIRREENGDTLRRSICF